MESCDRKKVWASMNHSILSGLQADIVAESHGTKVNRMRYQKEIPASSVIRKNIPSVRFVNLFTFRGGAPTFCKLICTILYKKYCPNRTLPDGRKSTFFAIRDQQVMIADSFLHVIQQVFYVSNYKPNPTCCQCSFFFMLYYMFLSSLHTFCCCNVLAFQRFTFIPFSKILFTCLFSRTHGINVRKSNKQYRLCFLKLEITNHTFTVISYVPPPVNFGSLLHFRVFKPNLIFFSERYRLPPVFLLERQ